MKKAIVEWFTAVGLIVIILAVLALGGVLLTTTAVAATIVFAVLVVADVVIGACSGLSSLFSPKRSEGEKERGG